MRVLFVPLPFPTHYFPTVGLAWALRLAGAEVRVATGADIAEVVDRSGIPAVTVNTQPELITAPRKEKWLELERMPEEGLAGALVSGPLDNYAKIAWAMADDLVTFAEGWRPDLIISDPLAYAGPLAAEVTGTVPVRHLWGVDSPRQFRLPGSGFDEDDPHREVPWRALPWPPRLLELFERHRATPRDDLAVCTVDPCPPSLQVPGMANPLPVRYTPYNGTGLVPGWLLEPRKRPRICVTWGLASTATLGEEFFGVPAILDAISGLEGDYEVVVAARGSDAERIGPRPEGVRVEQVPLHALLPSCDAIVHHGGSGTLFTAACYGVPQLVLAMMHEHTTAATPFAEQGAAVLLSGAEAGVPEIRDALAGILGGPATGKAAAALAAEIRAQPAPAEAAARLRALVEAT
ncbi:nucleotide disphospho-sugar-binding domain-containing protein [Amycolatopsis cihanbeyliensis]|uniref:UDP:flavonoid glycosyltransferase YjiC (YdhE family) n=1 Tax=Amycolatopsis cihanbeyliensis TaxID=1128664 RepID=A0A542DJC5_AMYCI|nr:nucleotide disphospho-sugar-binding domain-containing protein [Amycolatopsis cihanbeyliensis]TQJ03199.1 UDP:flavonoid glycosyltransferase YjiC (YdhE family) [Amycolatopsis cihanbeyliensis]WCB87240.1 EfrGI [Amycolatopsis cihanbeyliensis]